MKLKIIPLYAQIRKELEALCPGIVWHDILSSERGGKKIRGPHVDVFVPVSQPMNDQLVASILNVFEDYFADTRNFKKKRGLHDIGEGRPKYRLLTFDYDNAS